jgi:hypothetical protein
MDHHLGAFVTFWYEYEWMKMYNDIVYTCEVQYVMCNWKAIANDNCKILFFFKCLNIC